MADRLKLREDLRPPWVRGIGNTPFPRWNRFYFRFEAPIHTSHLTQTATEETIWETREQTRRAIEDGLEALATVRDNDPERHFPTRLGRALRRRLLR